jgi:hypothetical protein
MNTRGTLSSETLFGEAKRRGMIDESVEWDEEKVRIANDPLMVLASEDTGGGTTPPKPGSKKPANDDAPPATEAA